MDDNERCVLQWTDREGHALSTIGPTAAYRDFALSPDGRRIAYGEIDPITHHQRVWVRDLDRGVSFRLTSAADALFDLGFYLTIIS